MRSRRRPALELACALSLAAACGGAEEGPAGAVIVTLSASEVGREAELLRRQLARFARAYPDLRVELRSTPDAADQRHQLYVQWLNAHVAEPDVLQLDVVWTPEFAAAGWILPIEPASADASDFFPATLAAHRWEGRLHAVPWFVDVGMLYWRTDLLAGPPATLEELAAAASSARGGDVPYGFVWQGARYEGLVTVFLEVLGAYGGKILDEAGRVAVADDPGVRALRFLTSAIHGAGFVPPDVLGWQEEQTRFAFQNGRAVFMRNWPYAYPLMDAPDESAVAGRFSVAPMPGAPGGAPTAALGGAALALNARSRHPDVARRLIEYLTRPEQMLERAEVLGHYPPRVSLYDDPRLAAALPIPPADAAAVLQRALPRPAVPVYSELSGILQLWLHRALSGQREPAEALAEAALEMRRLLERVELAPAEPASAELAPAGGTASGGDAGGTGAP
jgi:multiple sugar transport system substrate-binding protein